MRIQKKNKPRVPAIVKVNAKHMDNALEKYGLTLQQELFCQYYTSPTEFYGNGVHSYLAAYGLDTANISHYNTAKSAACGLLVKPHVLKRIDSLMEEKGFNDQNADKQLLFLMSQHSDFNSKLGAIREYNKIKGRITQKIDHTLNNPVTGIRVIRVDPEDVREARARITANNNDDSQQRDASEEGDEEE